MKKSKLLIYGLMTISLLGMSLGASSCSLLNNRNSSSSKNTASLSNGGNESSSSSEEGTEGLHYKLLDDGTYSVTAGDTAGFTRVVIPAEYDGIKVTEIGDAAFYNCSKLVHISIPDTITSIGYRAFDSCSALKSVIIPEHVTSIGEQAFSSCSTLTSLTIPDSVTSIGSSAFSGCDSLNYNKYYEVSYLGNSNNPYVVLVKNESSDSSSFWLNENCKFIYDSAFDGCSELTSLTLPDSVVSIGNYAFRNCSALTSFAIPDKVTEIGESAFYGCTSLTTLTIPDAVTEIGSKAFSSCSKIEYTSYDNALYLGNENNPYVVLVKVSSQSVSSCQINEKCRLIYVAAFYNCTSLTCISVPGSVISIGKNAFTSCSALNSINIPESVKSIGAYAFTSCSSLKDIYYDGTEEEWNAVSKTDASVPSEAEIHCNNNL